MDFLNTILDNLRKVKLGLSMQDLPSNPHTGCEE